VESQTKQGGGAAWGRIRVGQHWGGAAWGWGSMGMGQQGGWGSME